jgi:hypothetical protein
MWEGRRPAEDALKPAAARIELPREKLLALFIRKVPY